MDTARLRVRQAVGWLGVLLWMGLIFCFSAQNAEQSTHSSETVLDFLLRLVRAEEPEAADDTTMLHFLLRKGAHFTVFTVLGLLLCGAVHQYPNADRMQRIVIPLSLGVVYACMDELHQYFVPGRACQILDVGIDTLGVIFGVSIGLGIVFLLRRRKQTTDVRTTGQQTVRP